MKVSLISTVYNEESSIEEFLRGIHSQTLKPDEIIIVDGGSTDNTIEIINNHIKNGEPIRLIIEKGANISRGRNIAIKHAINEIIAATDAGCRLDKDWLNNLINKFDSNIDVVGGITIPDPKNDFEKCVIEVTTTKIEDINENTYLPSSRSIAFRKSAWEEVGGYPEYLYTAEDTLFDLKLKNSGFKFSIAKDAVVYWNIRNNIRSLFKQYYLYGKGNKEAGLTTNKNILNRILDIISPFAMIFIIPPLIDSYLIAFWIFPFLLTIRPFITLGIKCYRLDKKINMFIYGIIIKYLVSAAWLIGMILGKKKTNVVIS